MTVTSINGDLLREMFERGAQNLSANRHIVDELNVFPVPDGDTGTNMYLTFSNSVKELSKLTDLSLYAVAKTASSGALIGARGNSGVILSQLLRGVARSCKNKTALDITGIAEAITMAATQAYKAVMMPTEGTILTVAREMGEFADAHALEYDDMAAFLADVLDTGKKALAKTPDLLPVLKEAGVVDAGGQGLIFILEGMMSVITGEPLADGPEQPAETAPAAEPEEDETAGYCVKYTILGIESGAIEKHQAYLSVIGKAKNPVIGAEGVSFHVDTDHPGKAVEKAVKAGPVTDIAIVNKQLKREEAPGEAVPYGFVAVSPGEGLTQIFKEVGVQGVISGGQTMNPSTEDFLAEIKKINAEHIFVFPNNGNIIMAANQAKEMSEKNVHVIPTKTIPQCVSTMLAFDPDAAWDDNEARMNDVLQNVACGEVTYAVRDTKIGGKKIAKGDIIGIFQKDIVAVGRDVAGVTKDLLSEMVTDESEFISLYYGSDVSDDEANALRADLEAAYPDCDVEVGLGGQPLYYYFVAVE